MIESRKSYNLFINRATKYRGADIIHGKRCKVHGAGQCIEFIEERKVQGDAMSLSKGARACTGLFLRLILMFFLSLNLQTSFGQDIHFSQYTTAPLYLNPALTGIFEGTHQVSMNNRMQWKAVTVPYLTFSAAGETHLLFREKQQDVFSAGVNLYRDVAGDSKFGTTQFNLYFSYAKAIDKKNKHILSVGIQDGIAQRSFDTEDLTFDAQFDGYKFDPNLYKQETFATTSFFYHDLGLGLNWRYQEQRYQTINTGISISHLNKPRQSVYDDNTVRLDPRITLYSFANYEVFHGFQVNPSILYQRQGKFNEFVIGSLFKFVKITLPKDYYAINFGLYVRTSDAAIVTFGIDRVNTYFGLSYDVNYSDLVVASHFRGGLEMAIIHRIFRSKTVRMKSIPCPIF